MPVILLVLDNEFVFPSNLTKGLKFIPGFSRLGVVWLGVPDSVMFCTIKFPVAATPDTSCQTVLVPLIVRPLSAFNQSVLFVGIPPGLWL